MKKSILIWLLVIAIVASGCAASNNSVSQTTAATTPATTEELATEARVETTAAPVTEQTDAATTEAETEPALTDDIPDDYLALVEEQSNLLKAALQQDTLKQSEMNMLSQQLYELWDGVLNDLWSKLQSSLPDEAFDKLLDEQIQWIEDKEAAIEEAGKDFAGGSLYPLITNGEAAAITEARVYELYELWKQTKTP
jgi:uncharacterized protein YecT (DUF1311 family)